MHRGNDGQNGSQEKQKFKFCLVNFLSCFYLLVFAASVHLFKFHHLKDLKTWSAKKSHFFNQKWKNWKMPLKCIFSSFYLDISLWQGLLNMQMMETVKVFFFNWAHFLDSLPSLLAFLDMHLQTTLKLKNSSPWRSSHCSFAFCLELPAHFLFQLSQKLGPKSLQHHEI